MKVKVVAKGIIYKDNKILLQLRDNKPHIPNPNTWSLFGGGVEEGETPEQALIREIQEELGISVSDPEFILKRNREEKNTLVEEWIYKVEADNIGTNGKITTTEGQSACFFDKENIEQININQIYLDLIKGFLH